MKRLPVERRLVVVLALVLVAVIVVVGLVLGDSEGEAGSDTGARSETSSPSSPAAQPAAPTSARPQAAPVDADQPPPLLPAVGLDGSVPADDVTVSVARVERIDGSGVGPGNLAGPAVRVTVRLTNEQPDAVMVGLVAVSLTYGVENTPASPLEDPSVQPLRGELDPGETAEGRYVFSLPRDSGDIQLRVGWQAPAPVAVFVGPA